MSRAVSLTTLCVLLGLSIGCQSQPVPKGSVRFAATLSQAVMASSVSRLTVTVSAADMPAVTVELSPTHGVWGGVIGGLPTGSGRTFLGQAYDSGGRRLYEGQTANVTLTANQTTVVVLTLQQLNHPLPLSNEAPLIDSAVASPASVQAGGTVSLGTSAHDPNAGDTITYAWTASGGSFSNASRAPTTWTAPALTGLYTLTLTVSDNRGAASSVDIPVNVVNGSGEASAEVAVRFNHWPVVSRVDGLAGRLNVGQPATVTATATDSDGDTLGYQWSATCSGTWEGATHSTARFTPSAVPSGACNNCQLTVAVTDGRGGEGTATLSICVAAANPQRFPPNVTGYQSAVSVQAGQQVTLGVSASDPQGSTLSFGWRTNVGALGAAQDTATSSRIVWTAPTCVVSGVVPTMTATVTNAYGQSTMRGFTVTALPACTPGWVSAASMASARHEHTAVVLPSGRVLVAGAHLGSSILATAEVYDPGTNTWFSAGSMASPRYAHTAVVLPAGKVLAAGGCDGVVALGTVDVYDPGTNTWSSAGSMASPRYIHTAVVLPSGKVLVAGGYNRSVALAAAEVYDPGSNTWTSAGSMASARYSHTAVVLPSGKVLVVGGSNGSALATAEVYDPGTNTWSSVGSMASPRYAHIAVLLPSGKVLVAGGYNSSALATAEVYDPGTNTWSSAGSMISARYSHTVVLLPSGKVLVAGGYNSSALATAEVYDPGTNTWSSAGSMASVRSDHTAVLLPSGRVFVAGGYSSYSGSGIFSTAEVYTP